MDDLATLNELDERIILEIVNNRYEEDKIYTYIGDILLAVNPYKPLPLYTFEISREYAGLKYRQSLPPHIFAVADKCYGAMRRNGSKQSCVISGESGAGKTETAKYLIGHIISHCSSCKPNLQEKILQVNPLLEAFGNASTLINQNSSRFGKYLELLFQHDGKVVGAKIDTYLLEKSRVVTQEAGERNFHIFYFMFAGLTEQQLAKILLSPPEQYRILNNGGQGVFYSENHFFHCQRMYDELQDIMELVGFTQEDIWMIFTLLSAIIQVTDINFSEDQDTGGAFIEDEYVTKVVSQLLGLDAQELIDALITTAVEARGEKIMALKSCAQAVDARDALAKALYGKLFHWIVSKINHILAPDADFQPSLGHEIGILDIYGFENFKLNSFEQLCINLTNEQLQFYFNQRIFKWELEEYSKEGVKKTNISFQDNMPILDLLLGRPVGVFSLLDEESKFPKATNTTLVNKIAHNHQKNKNFLREKRANTTQFGIKHFAGEIFYEANGFLEKNRDSFSGSLTDCLLQSQNGLVKFLFSNDNADLARISSFQKDILLCKPPPKILHDKNVSISRATGRRLSKQFKENKRNDPKKRMSTISSVGSKFKVSLSELMAKLLTSEPQFIRCLKPNEEARHNLFKFDLILRQLRYTGVLETIRIRREGYPTRLTFEEFLKRYKFLVYPLTMEIKPNEKSCKKLLKTIGLSNYEIGKTKVFMKFWLAEKLDVMIDQQINYVTICQKLVRGFMARRRFKAMYNQFITYRQMVEHFLWPLEDASSQILNVLNSLAKLDVTRHETIKKEALYADLQIAVQKKAELKKELDEIKEQVQTEPLQPHYHKRQAPPVAQRKYAPTQSPTSPSQIQTFESQIEEEIIKDVNQQLSHLSQEAWLKMYFMEKDVRLGEFNIRSDSVIADGYVFQMPGRLGFGALKNPLRDNQTEKVRSHIGKGVQLHRDSEGNVWATRLSKNDIIVKGSFEPDKHCISQEVVAIYGKLPRNMPMKIFDIKEFKIQLAIECNKGRNGMDHIKIQKLCMVSISFVKDAVKDIDTPCWITVVVLPALRLDILTPKVQEDISKIAHAIKPPTDVQKTNMGRSTSKRWAKEIMRLSNFQKEKNDGRSARLNGQRKSQEQGMSANYSWDADPEESSEEMFSSRVSTSRKGQVLRSLSIRNAATFKLRYADFPDSDQPTSPNGGLANRRSWARTRQADRDQGALDTED